MRLQDLLVGETPAAQQALEKLFGSIGDERILWYPSAGSDYRDILETMPERLRLHGMSEPGPNIFCHTDYTPLLSRITPLTEPDKFSEVLFSDENTLIIVLEQHPVNIRNGIDIHYAVNRDHITFYDAIQPEPRISLLKILASSAQLGETTVHLLYFFFENHNFMHEVVLKHGLKVPFFVKVREGCGFGGCRKCISSFYPHLADAGVKYLLIDAEVHFDKNDWKPGPADFDLKKLGAPLNWSGFSVYPYEVVEQEGLLSTEKLDRILKTIHGCWGGSCYS
jgi:hypothetical protein